MVLQSSVSFKFDNTQTLSSFTSKTSNYSLGGSYPIQDIDVIYQGSIENLYTQIQLLVRKDYIDVPANELLLEENNVGISDYFNEKISVDSEYNLYLYTGNSMELNSGGGHLQIELGLDYENFLYEWNIRQL